MEFLENGDMQTFINQEYTCKPQEYIRIVSEILEALSYLHARGISHRDIKPANIMFDKNFHPKLIDFGFCRENSPKLKTYCGTDLLIAPEIMRHRCYDGEKADMWSFGVTAHIFVTRNLPFEYKSDSQYWKDVKNRTLKIENQAHGIIGWLVDQTVKINPDERMEAGELLENLKNKITEEYNFVRQIKPGFVISTAVLPKNKTMINPKFVNRARIITYNATFMDRLNHMGPLNQEAL